MAWIEAGSRAPATADRCGDARCWRRAAAAVATVAGGAGAAVPTCGGNQSIKVSPYTCHQERLIDGTTFSVVLDVSAGGVVTVTYTLDTPRRRGHPTAHPVPPGHLFQPGRERRRHRPAGRGHERHAVRRPALRPDRREGRLHRQWRRPRAGHGAVRHGLVGLPVDTDHAADERHHAAADDPAAHDGAHHASADRRDEHPDDADVSQPGAADRRRRRPWPAPRPCR